MLRLIFSAIYVSLFCRLELPRLIEAIAGVAAGAGASDAYDGNVMLITFPPHDHFQECVMSGSRFHALICPRLCNAQHPLPFD